MRLYVLAVSCTLVMSMSLAARADDTPSAQGSGAYADFIRRGLEEYSLGHWAEARSFFARAHTLQPSARTLRGLALSSYELRSYVDAIGYFERALAESDQALTGRMRQEAEQFLTESRLFVTTVTVDLEPDNARIIVDDKPMQLTADHTLQLDPGNHTLSAEAEGYETAAQNIVTRGQHEPINIRLRLKATSEQVASQAPFAPVPQQTNDAHTAGSTPSTGPWIVMGASAAVAITGGVFLGVAVASKSDAEQPGPDPSYREVQDAAARGRLFFPLGITLVGVGAAGIATGIAWKYWPIFGRSEHAALSLSPSGVVLRGRF
jgi:hypothetical protein